MRNFVREFTKMVLTRTNVLYIIDTVTRTNIQEPVLVNENRCKQIPQDGLTSGLQQRRTPMYNHSATVTIKNPGFCTGHISRDITVDKRRMALLGAAAAGMLVVLILLSAMLSPKITFAKNDSAGPVYESVCIETGDTVWDIASRYVSSGTEIRSLVREIEQLNHISSDFIYEGQYLIVPVSSGS